MRFGKLTVFVIFILSVAGVALSYGNFLTRKTKAAWDAEKAALDQAITKGNAAIAAAHQAIHTPNTGIVAQLESIRGAMNQKVQESNAQLTRTRGETTTAKAEYATAKEAGREQATLIAQNLTQVAELREQLADIKVRRDLERERFVHESVLQIQMFELVVGLEGQLTATMGLFADLVRSVEQLRGSEAKTATLESEQPRSTATAQPSPSTK